MFGVYILICILTVFWAFYGQILFDFAQFLQKNVYFFTVKLYLILQK